MSQQTDPTAPFAPRTYQSAWQWNDDETARLMSAEEWLEEEADVDAALAAVEGMDCDSAPNRGGIMLAIAKEIRSLRAERTQWANEFTQQTARLAALTAENERLRETLTLGLGEQESVIAGLRAENEILRRALIAHRADLHNGSSRPCPTCYQSAHALGIADRVPDCCASAGTDAAALPSSRETTDGRTDPS